MNIQKNRISYIPTILTYSLLCYLIILTISYSFYHIHESNLIRNYNKYSLIVAITQYKIFIIIWGIVGIMYIYLQCGGYDSYQEDSYRGQEVKQVNVINIGEIEKQNTSNDNKFVTYIIQKLCIIWSQRILIFCIISTIAYLHSTHTIQTSMETHSKLYSTFKFGNNHQKQQNNYTTNYDVSWPGFYYYYSDNYYYQTKQRLEHTRAKLIPLMEYQNILLALKYLSDGIYAMKGWLANHRFGYEIMRIWWGNLGMAFISIMWGLWIWGLIIGKGCGWKIVKFMIFITIWVNIIFTGFLGQTIQSLINLNKHQLCIPQPNSSVISITINSQSSKLISELKLNIIQDPNKLFQNICYNMQKYYKEPLEIDQNIIKYCINVLMFSMICMMVSQICSMMGSGKMRQLWRNYSKKNNDYSYVSDTQ